MLAFKRLRWLLTMNCSVDFTSQFIEKYILLENPEFLFSQYLLTTYFLIRNENLALVIVTQAKFFSTVKYINARIVIKRKQNKKTEQVTNVISGIEYIALNNARFSWISNYIIKQKQLQTSKSVITKANSASHLT